MIVPQRLVTCWQSAAGVSLSTVRSHKQMIWTSCTWHSECRSTFIHCAVTTQPCSWSAKQSLAVLHTSALYPGLVHASSFYYTVLVCFTFLNSPVLYNTLQYSSLTYTPLNSVLNSAPHCYILHCSKFFLSSSPVCCTSPCPYFFPLICPPFWCPLICSTLL